MGHSLPVAFVSTKFKLNLLYLYIPFQINKLPLSSLTPKTQNSFLIKKIRILDLKVLHYFIIIFTGELVTLPEEKNLCFYPFYSPPPPIAISVKSTSHSIIVNVQ